VQEARFNLDQHMEEASMRPQMGHLKLRPSYFAEAILKLNGKPFSLKGREYLRKVHDSNYKSVILRTARQVEKSTTLAVHMLTRALLIPYFTALYISPSSKQTRAFSAQKLNPFISTSDFIQRYYVDSSCTDRVFEKSFTNGSRIILDYVFQTPDRVRGISADALYLDEIQDIMSEHVPVIEETLAHSDKKWRIYAGTPKRYQNTIENYWRRSSQTEWVVKCDHCGHWNVLGEKNVQKKGLSCARCGELLNVRHGEWVNGKRDFEFKGIRISQLTVPWMSWEEIWRKYRDYPISKFYNEVLGLPYEDASRPLTFDELVAVCENRPMLQSYDPAMFRGEPLYMGIDYATGTGENAFTVVVIGGFIGEYFKVVYAKRYKGIEADLSYVVEDLARLAQKFRVARIGADWGVGSGGANQFLRKRVNTGGEERVVEFYYSSNQRELIKWDWRGYKYILNRTEAMSLVFTRIKDGKITFPRWSEWEPFGQDFLNIYQDFSDVSQKVFYDHEEGYPDDTFHATLYAYFIGMMDKGMLDRYISKRV